MSVNTEEALYQMLQDETVNHGIWPGCRCIKCDWCEDYRNRKAARHWAWFEQRTSSDATYDPEL